MRVSRSLLIIEDDVLFGDSLVPLMASLGLSVKIANQGGEGLRLWEQHKPDIVILDLELPDCDGMEILRAARRVPRIERTSVVVLTGYDDRAAEAFQLHADYLIKPPRAAELVAKIEGLMRQLPAFAEQAGRIVSIRVEKDQKVFASASGHPALLTSSSSTLQLDVSSEQRGGSNALSSDDWRYEVQARGKDLFKRVVEDHPEILAAYHQILGAHDDSDVRLVIEAPADYVGVPFEFLVNSDGRRGKEFVVLTHCLCRSIFAIQPRVEPLSAPFFNRLIRNREALRVLLIASNTSMPTPIPGVDEEINVLSSRLRELFARRGLSVDVAQVPTESATVGRLRDLLVGNSFHIVHYAGHGDYATRRPEESALYFWREPNRAGAAEPLLSTQLYDLLRKSTVNFFYLSTCYGTATAGSVKLQDNAFLGLADCIVRAGVPGTLGFRIPVSDSGAVALATHFYESLADHGEPDIALHYARRAVWATAINDRAWISPILIKQG